MRYEAEIGRFFNEYPGKDRDPQNSDYRLKFLLKDEANQPTPHVIESKHSWTYRETRSFTKLCVDADVPDVEQRISGRVSNQLFIYEIPRKSKAA